MKSTVYLLISIAALLSQAAVAAPLVKLEITDHLFYPAVIEIPAHTKVKLLIINNDSTPEEFESYQLNREKVLLGNSKAVVFIGPLQPGEYQFFGEFNLSTAQGKIIVKENP